LQETRFLALVQDLSQLTLNWKAEWLVPQDYVQGINTGYDRIKEKFILAKQLSLF